MTPDSLAAVSPPHETFDLIGITFGVPIFGILVMTGVESLIDTRGWKCRVVRFGWDLSVLAIGIVGGVFALPELSRGRDVRDAALLGALSLLVCLSAGVAIMHARKVHESQITGLRALIALGSGLVALTLPMYFVVTG